MPIKLVVFDMAGTTIKDENYVHLTLQNALKKAEIDSSLEEINLVMGYPKPVAISMILENHQNNGVLIDAEKHSIDSIHRLFEHEMVDFYQSSPLLQEAPKAGEVFQLLQEKGIKVILDTGFSREIADVIIDRLNWRDKIFASVTSDEVAKGRPHPDMIFKAMELAGLDDAQEVAKVGDTASDLQEGTSAGCKYVIGVTSGAFPKEDLEKEPHTHLISELSEILNILELESVQA